MTEFQLREVFCLLEAGEPLPKHYRFLLFDEPHVSELLWRGKTDAVCDAVFPLKTVENFDNRAEIFGGPRDTGPVVAKTPWRNKLILGDNRDVLSTLIRGPLRAEIERVGGLRLVYIDPPFNQGTVFTASVSVGDTDDNAVADANGGTGRTPLDIPAYCDRWGRGEDGFLSMIHERLLLIRDLLAEDGTLYVHGDWRTHARLRLILDEVFSPENFRNEITWHYTNTGLKARSRKFHQVADTLLVYAKSDRFTFHPLYKDRKDGQVKQARRRFNSATRKAEIVRDDAGRIVYEIRDKILVNSLWETGSMSNSPERRGYPTQKPEALLERIVEAASDPGDLVADFFCGSGTLAAVAEKTGRKWIAVDASSLAIHVARKRLLDLRRRWQEQGGRFTSFEILEIEDAESRGDSQDGGRTDLPRGEIEAKVLVKNGAVAVALTGFRVPDTPLENAAKTRLRGTTARFAGRLIVENGNLVRLRHRRSAVAEREVLTRCWSDWIDYWAVDFRCGNRESGSRDGPIVFTGDWQCYRTTDEPVLARTSPFLALDADGSSKRKGKRTLAVKVVDLFGRDTTLTLEF